MLEFGQTVNTTVNKYIWKQVSRVQVIYSWNKAYTYHHSFLGNFIRHKLTVKVLHFTISALIVIASNLLSIVQNSQAAAIKEGVLTENDF